MDVPCTLVFPTPVDFIYAVGANHLPAGQSVIAAMRCGNVIDIEACTVLELAGPCGIPSSFLSRSGDLSMLAGKL